MTFDKDTLKSLLCFDSMLTPKIITFVYWLALIGVVISGVGMLFANSPIAGIMTIVGGGIAARIWGELLIVLFKINENIQKLANKDV